MRFVNVSTFFHIPDYKQQIRRELLNVEAYVMIEMCHTNKRDSGK